MLLAVTRAVPPSINRCELTHVAREVIDLARAEAQHTRYEEALRRAGCLVEHLPALPDLPDSVFVEDTAVVLDDVAVIMRPGAASRQPETETVAAALARHRPLLRIAEPGTLDGGDVLVVGRRVWVGVGGRTNLHGVRHLERHLAPHGYAVRGVEARGCLHLKSAATRVSESAVLVNPLWVDPSTFSPLEVIEVDPSEPFAANALLVEKTLLVSAACPHTAARVGARGIQVTPVDLSELAKAEGALTCCSLIFNQ
jgi:dimethylargininase